MSSPTHWHRIEPVEASDLTRRALFGASALAVVAARAARTEWRPKLGILGHYTPANLEFARREGFRNMIISEGGAIDPAHATDEQLASIKSAIAASGVQVSALQINGSHIDADAAERQRENTKFAKYIEVAGKLGVPYIGTQSGKDESKPFRTQVDEIVRTYNEKYFPLCQKYNVRILWEPWPGGANIATGPVGFDALLKAFNNSPYVGLQYDPSHEVWQFIDPIQTARDFVDHIYDVHLKDTEIDWNTLKWTGTNPPNRAEWWRYRLPGLGSIDWPAFFSVLQKAGYQGAMTIEHEDEYYGCCSGGDFAEDYKEGFRMAHKYLRQYVPEPGAPS